MFIITDFCNLHLFMKGSEGWFSLYVFKWELESLKLQRRHRYEKNATVTLLFLFVQNMVYHRYPN